MKNLRLIFVLLLVVLIYVFPAKASDKCHVYMIDVEKADQLTEAAMKAKTDEEAEKIGSQYVTMFDEFETIYREEEVRWFNYSREKTLCKMRG